MSNSNFLIRFDWSTPNSGRSYILISVYLESATEMLVLKKLLLITVATLCRASKESQEFLWISPVVNKRLSRKKSDI